MKLWEKIVTTYHEGRYGSLALLVLLTLGVIAALVVALAGIGLILAANIENIIGVVVMGGIIWGIFYCWAEERRSSKEKMENARLLLQQESDRQAAVQDRMLQETNYELLRDILFTTIPSIAEVGGVVKPRSRSELDSRERFVNKSGVDMCRFWVLSKSGIDFSDEIFHDIIQTRITQRLMASELSIENRTFIHDGRAYPVIAVDETQLVGQYVQIDLVWTTQRYLELLQLRKAAKLERPIKEGLHYDRDF